jgi:type II secretory pathway component PulM
MLWGAIVGVVCAVFLYFVVVRPVLSELSEVNTRLGAISSQLSDITERLGSNDDPAQRHIAPSSKPQTIVQNITASQK